MSFSDITCSIIPKYKLQSQQKTTTSTSSSSNKRQKINKSQSVNRSHYCNNDNITADQNFSIFCCCQLANLRQLIIDYSPLPNDLIELLITWVAYDDDAYFMFDHIE